MRGTPTVFAMTRPITIAQSTYSMFGKGDVVRFGVVGDRLLDELPGIADDGEQEQPGNERDDLLADAGSLAGGMATVVAMIFSLPGLQFLG